MKLLFTEVKKINNMKIFLQILIAAFFLLSCVKANDTPKKNGEEARCTGSSSCAACSNCSRCAHCSSGGSCGVCRGNSSGRSFSSYRANTKKKKTKSSVNTHAHSSSTSTLGVHTKQTGRNNIYSSNSGITTTVGKFMMLKVNAANVRKRPNLNAEIIEKLRKGSKLMIIEHQNSWYKVKVSQSGNIGYVHYSVVQ